MSTADHVTCCCAETLADIERLTQERDDARDTACRLEAELACPGYLTDLDAMPDPTPIIEWLASVGLDAQRIPADGVRIIGRTPLGGCLLLVQSFEVTPDGRRIILADGSGFARTRHRRIEVTTLPPEPWLTEWSAPPAEVGAAQMPEAARREGQEGAGNALSRAADGLAGSDRHSGTPATGEARKSAESDADDDDAEWDAREAIERARGGAISARDLADELLTLQPVDPARCNTRRKAHPVIGGRALECSECWRERVAERLEQWRQGIHAPHPQETK